MEERILACNLEPGMLYTRNWGGGPRVVLNVARSSISGVFNVVFLSPRGEIRKWAYNHFTELRVLV